jgi:two-component system, sporulation sensor kinase A
LIFLDYLINLSIFSLLVSIPLIIRSFYNFKTPRYFRFWGGIYGGAISVILVQLSFQINDFTYDIRYAPVILSFAYLGPFAGFLTGSFALIARLIEGNNWFPAITGWIIVLTVFLMIHHSFKTRLTHVQKCMTFFVAYIFIYIITVPIVFNIIRDNPFFHIQYLLFVLFGVIIGGLVIESYEKLYRLNKKFSELYKMMANYQKELKQTLVTLEKSEAKYRLIAENTSDLIMVMEKDYSISYFSPSHKKLLGYNEGELENTRLCKFVHPNDVQTFTETIKRIFDKRESHAMEFRLKHESGRYIEFESRWVPVMGENGEIEHSVIISRDITERKKSEEILLQSEKLSIVGELAAGVAHEIRNPLTTIKGFIQLYKKENSSIEFNDLLLNELERIETITSELLSLGKPQAVQLMRANLVDLIDNTLELLQPQAYMNNIQFNFSFQDSQIMITCEKNQLKQVFLNILKNAMEAMADGGSIDIVLQELNDNECMISFQDHGCGIPEDLLPRLGEPFYTLKEKGTGLGLMICHKIIKQHHGTITYHSKLNEGTLVEITLPLSRKAEISV